MKNYWWREKGTKFQQFADAHEFRGFFNTRKIYFVPLANGQAPLKSKDRSTILRPTLISVVDGESNLKNYYHVF